MEVTFSGCCAARHACEDTAVPEARSQPPEQLSDAPASPRSAGPASPSKYRRIAHSTIRFAASRGAAEYHAHKSSTVVLVTPVVSQGNLWDARRLWRSVHSPRLAVTFSRPQRYMRTAGDRPLDSQLIFPTRATPCTHDRTCGIAHRAHTSLPRVSIVTHPRSRLRIQHAPRFRYVNFVSRPLPVVRISRPLARRARRQCLPLYPLHTRVRPSDSRISAEPDRPRLLSDDNGAVRYSGRCR